MSQFWLWRLGSVRREDVLHLADMNVGNRMQNEGRCRNSVIVLCCVHAWLAGDEELSGRSKAEQAAAGLSKGLGAGAGRYSAQSVGSGGLQ